VTSSSEHPLAAFGEVGQLLLRTLETRRLSPSYLFEGMDPETLRKGALAFAAGILAGSPPGAADARAFQLAEAGTHPDLHVLTKDKATVISVKALTPVLERAHTTPLESEHQVFVIQPAEAMEPEGIGRYLKSLEEPPEGTVFILVSTHPERLPETVLSRCRRTRFPPLSDALLVRQLRAEDVDEAAAQAVCRYAGGSVVRARRMAECKVQAVAEDLCAAAVTPEPQVERAAAAALAHLQQEAASLAAAEKSETDTKRQQVRVLLSDLLRILCVEARERAAGRPSEMLRGAGPETSLRLLSGWGGLEAAVAANVTPAAILIEAAAVYRRVGLPEVRAR